MKLKFFSDDSEPSRSQRAPDDVAPGLRNEPPGTNPLNEVPRETASSNFDGLAVFTPEVPADDTDSTQTLIIDHTPRPVPSRASRGISKSPRADAASLDDLRGLLRQTEMALEHSKNDADALRLDLNHLRVTGTRLAQCYKKLSTDTEQTETRIELAAKSLVEIEDRVGSLSDFRDLSDSATERIAALRGLAAEVESRATDLQAQKEAIDVGLVRAAAVSDTLAALDARVTTLTEKHEWLAHAGDAVGDLEQRAAQTTADLERRVHHFGAQKRTIEEVLAEATRVTDIVTALDARLAALTGDGHNLQRAEEAVGDLVLRAAEATAELERLASAKRDLEAEPANIGQHLQTLGESASLPSMPAWTADMLPEPDALVASTRGGGTRTAPPLELWAACLAAFAVLAWLGTIAMRSGDQRDQVASAERAALGVSHLSASAPVLPSRTVRFGRIAVPVDRQARAITAVPTTRIAPAARPAKKADASESELRLSPLRDAAHPGDTARDRRAPAQPGRSSATSTVQPFQGILAVESIPPGAAVFVNQQRVGETPLRLSRVRAGSHAIRIEREGYERWTAAVRVPADEQTRVTAKLQPVR